MVSLIIVLICVEYPEDSVIEAGGNSLFTSAILFNCYKLVSCFRE